MTHLRSLEQTLSDNLPWNKARIKFVARFLLALFSQRTVNLARLATAFSGAASEASNYKRLQRFLHSFELPYAQIAHFVVQRLGEPGPGIAQNRPVDTRKCHDSLRRHTSPLTMPTLQSPADIRMKEAR